MNTLEQTNSSAPSEVTNFSAPLGVTNSPSVPAEVTNSPSKIRGGKGALTSTITTQHVINTADMKLLRRQLRSNGTPAEGALWNILKGKKVGGLQFRRQYSVGPHILDFYCSALRLAIELDGDYHFYGANPEHDMARDEDLSLNYNIRTLRFENKIVFQQPQTVVNSILEVQQEVNAPPSIKGGVKMTYHSMNTPEQTNCLSTLIEQTYSPSNRLEGARGTLITRRSRKRTKCGIKTRYSIWTQKEY